MLAGALWETGTNQTVSRCQIALVMNSRSSDEAQPSSYSSPDGNYAKQLLKLSVKLHGRQTA